MFQRSFSACRGCGNNLGFCPRRRAIISVAVTNADGDEFVPMSENRIVDEGDCGD